MTERAPLSRDRIAEAALALIDADGLDALTMRKLGASLDVEAMSLYNHVDNKDDVLTAASDVLSAEVSARYQAAPGRETWRNDARALAMAWWSVGLEHPNAFTLIADRVHDSPAAVQKMCDVYGVFDRTGLDTQSVVDSFHAAASYVVGAVRQEHTVLEALRGGAGFTAEQLPPEYQWLVDFKTVCTRTPGEEQFRRGLEIVLDGIAARIDGLPAAD